MTQIQVCPAQRRRKVQSLEAGSGKAICKDRFRPNLHHFYSSCEQKFGLIHGFGFASVLAELGLPAEGLVLSLLGFNVGVEVGQMAIVSGFLPVAFLLRNTRFYMRGIFALGSWLTMLVALIWLLERAFDLKLVSP